MTKENIKDNFELRVQNETANLKLHEIASPGPFTFGLVSAEL